MGEQIQNWAGTASCRPHRYYVPLDEADVVVAVHEAARLGRPVRVVGSRHSWSDAAMSDDILLDLGRLQGIRAIDGFNVTVGAGTTIRALNRALQERGLALSNLGSVDAQTIAGAISTATHGSSLQHGVMPTQIVGLRMVTADGQVRMLSAQSDPTLFDQARVSFGCLGIITEVTIRCEPAFRLRETVSLLAIDDAIEQAVSLGAAAEYAKLWWLPHTTQAVLFTAERVDAARQPQPLSDWLDARVANPLVFNGLVRLGDRFPSVIPMVNRLILSGAFRPRQRVEDSHRVLHLAMPPVHRETEYALPVARASDALAGVRALIDDGGFRVNFIVELRFVKGDALPMSPAFGRDSCYIGGYIGAGADAERYMSAVESMAMDMDGRPHWGKFFRQPSAALQARYPQWDAFIEARQALDPEGRFLSPFVRRVLGLDTSETALG